jgi:hypothetical protein
MVSCPVKSDGVDEERKKAPKRLRREPVGSGAAARRRRVLVVRAVADPVDRGAVPARRHGHREDAGAHFRLRIHDDRAVGADRTVIDELRRPDGDTDAGAGDAVTTLCGFGDGRAGRRGREQQFRRAGADGVVLVSRQGNGGEDADDGHHNHQFDEREAALD